MIDLISLATRSASASLLLLICTDHPLVKYLADAVANIGSRYNDIPSNISISTVVTAQVVMAVIKLCTLNEISSFLQKERVQRI